MCKNRRFKCLLLVATWDKGYTTVRKYKKVMIYIYGKTAKKAVEGTDIKHPILRVWAG